MDEVKEEWRPIPGYGDMVYISNYGRVLKHGENGRQDKILCQRKGRIPSVNIRYKGCVRSASIPLLLDLTFGIEGKGLYYGFKDGNNQNLYVGNVYRTPIKPKSSKPKLKKEGGNYNCIYTLNDTDTYYVVRNREELKIKGINQRLVDICFSEKYMGRAISDKTSNGVETLVVCREGAKD